MKWLLRTAVALSLLACLGYASYAFGLYILSKRLFGDSVMQKAPDISASHSATITKSVTRKSRDKNARAGAEVNVLDAQNAGPGPAAPSLDTLERETRARDYTAPRTQSRQRIITAESLKTVKRSARSDNSDNGDNAPREYSQRDSSDENRPRRRRRRRRRTTSDTSSNSTRSNARRDSTSSDSSTRDTSPSRSERPSRESSSDSSSSAPRRERRIESPVPSEGGGGSSQRESPVPLPE